MQTNKNYTISDKLLKSMEDYLIDLRRDLHKHPELSFEEFYTSEGVRYQFYNTKYNSDGNIPRGLD